MSDEIVSPLVVYRPFVGLLTVGQMAARMAEPGITAATLESRLRYWAKLRLIHVRDQRGTGSNAANLFDWEDLAVAKLLSELSELGVADTGVLEAASRGLYAPPAGETHRSGVIAAALGFRRGEWWTFQLDTWRHSETGERRICAGVLQPFQGGTVENADRTIVDGRPVVTPLQDAGFDIKASLVMEMPPLLERIYSDRSTAN